MSQTQTETVLDRPTQILDAAVACFAKRGFHQASMHDISAEAGISDLTSRQMAELIFAVNDGMLLRGVLKVGQTSSESRERQLEVVRNLWRLMFKKEGERAYA